MKKFLITLFLFCTFFWLVPVHAANFLGTAQSNLNKAVGGVGFEKNISTSVGNLISVALSLVGTIFFILTIYAGFLWMTAGGNEENVGKAKKILIAAVIGLVIVMSAYAITYFVTSQLGGAAGGGEQDKTTGMPKSGGDPEDIPEPSVGKCCTYDCIVCDDVWAPNGICPVKDSDGNDLEGTTGDTNVEDCEG